MNKHESPWYRFSRYSEQLERELCSVSKEKIREIQWNRLSQVIHYAWEHIPFYRWYWGEAGVHPDQVRSLEDMVKLPVWNKKIQKMVIESHAPFGNYYTFSELSESDFIVSTSGTTGLPIMMPLKHDDIPGLQDTMARCFGFIGIGPSDIVQILFTYSTMGAAWASTWAAQGVGASVLPTSSGKTTSSLKQVSWIFQAGVTVLIGTASYIKHLAEVAVEEGYNPAASKVRFVVTAGEMVSESTRRAIESMWGAKSYDVFGTVDTMSWSSVDCEHSRSTFGTTGMHIWEDSVLIEVLNENGNRCKNAEYGNMTITSWAWKNSPRIRYSLGDAIAVDETPCACGRTLARMLPIKGRIDDVIRFHGQNIYPLAVENFVKSVDQEFNEYMVELTREDGKEKLILTVESTRAEESLQQYICQRFNALFNVMPQVHIVLPGSTAVYTGAGKEPKIRRIFDRRSD